MPEKKTYLGSCHCGAVRIRATTDLAQVIRCNCSICSRAGYVLAFVPEGDFVLEAGEGAQTDYQFGKKHIHHTFCSSCGVRTFSHGETKDGSTTYAVNVRCLEGVDVGALAVTDFDGRSV